MDSVYETLFRPLTTGRLHLPGGQILFLNAAACPGLALLSKHETLLQQYQKETAGGLQEEGYEAVSQIPEGEAVDCLLLAAPKNIIETRAMLGLGLQLLKPGGLVIAAGANDAGGARLAGLLEEAGCSGVESDSKNRARVVWGLAENLNKEILKEWAAAGSMQKIAGMNFVSVPGIFGWDKIDRGSELLARQLPASLRGEGADFGCGYGYLAVHVMQKCEGVKSLACIDADFRAIECARKNLEVWKARTRFYWEDLRAPLVSLRDLDFIVMNPPFHSGKSTDITLGRDFIVSAAVSLRGGGGLWMVANETLAYEETLARNFSRHERTYEGEGFKIFHAVK